MRHPSESIASPAPDAANPALRGPAGGGQIEIGVSDAADMQEFRTWWKAHVKETRYWGGGPDGAWSGAAASAG